MPASDERNQIPHHHRQHTRPRDGNRVYPREPYPFIYSKDPFDSRRFARPWAPYQPAYNAPSRAATAFSLAVLAGVGALALISIILGLAGR
jgi:hypothetical protein